MKLDKRIGVALAAGVALSACGVGGDICVDASSNYSCSACTLELCEDADHKCTWYQTSTGVRYEAGCPLDATEAVPALTRAKAHCGCS